MNDIVEQITYKGYCIDIVHDDEHLIDDNPNDWNNNVQLAHFHRGCWIESEAITEEQTKDYYQGDEETQEMFDKDWFVFPVSAYIHSGVHLSLNKSFTCDPQGWDTSHVGVMLVKKTIAKVKHEAYDVARVTLDTWNDLLAGNVYGYNISPSGAEGEIIDSCWSFIGDYETSGIIEEAKSQVDYYVEEERKEKQAQPKPTGKVQGTTTVCFLKEFEEKNRKLFERLPYFHSWVSFIYDEVPVEYGGRITAKYKFTDKT